MRWKTSRGARESLRRVTWAVGLLALTPLAVFAALSGQGMVAAFERHARNDEDRLRDSARTIASSIDAEMGRRIAALQALASSPLLDGALDAERFAAQSRVVAELFGGWIVLLGQPLGYRPLTVSNQPDQSSLPASLPPEHIDTLHSLLTEVFEHGRPAVSDLFEGAVVRRRIVTVMVPVERESMARRALALSFEPSTLQLLMERLGPATALYVVLSDGQSRTLTNSVDAVGSHVGRPVEQDFRAAIEGSQNAAVVGRSAGGKASVFAIERLRHVPNWAVLVAEPLSAHLASTKLAVGWFIGGLSSFAVLLAGLVWVSRREKLLDAQAEAAALRAGRADVSRLLDGLPAIIFVREVAPDGSSVKIHRYGDLEAVTGWPRAEVAIRESLQDLAHPNDPTLEQEMKRVLREGATAFEWRLRQPSGGWRRLHTQARVMTRRDNGGAEVVGYTVDISARREAEARALVSARLASLGEMAAGLAHELKQPLQSIMLAAELAEDAAEKGDTTLLRLRLQRIALQTERTASLIDRFRSFGAGGRDEVALESVALADVVRGALELTGSALREASISLDIELGEPPPFVHGNAVLLEQVLCNLLLNARDAMTSRPAEMPRRIRITAAADVAGSVQLEVGDTGGGIVPSVMDRLFEPFVTTKAADQGTGLGLSICHGVVRRMGGSIEARNDAEGAVFTITLPSAAAVERSSFT